MEGSRHGADEGFNARCGLVVGCPEAAAHVLVVEDLNFEGEILLKLRAEGRGSERERDRGKKATVRDGGGWGGHLGAPGEGGELEE